MKIKSLITPIGNFNSFYVNSLLVKLVYINNLKSTYKSDLSLQKIMSKFFSKGGLRKIPECSPQGTPFQLKLWDALIQIPRGQTDSYSSLASKIGFPGAARAVGTACRLNPIPLLIPCHRAVRKDGSIGDFALGKSNKAYLLTMESKWAHTITS